MALQCQLCSRVFPAEADEIEKTGCRRRVCLSQIPLSQTLLRNSWLSKGNLSGKRTWLQDSPKLQSTNCHFSKTIQIAPQHLETSCNLLCNNTEFSLLGAGGFHHSYRTR